MPESNVVIDLSHHNQNLDFAGIRSSGILGIIHKATQGLDYTDPTYLPHRTSALANDLLWGAYHFGTGTSDGGQQAGHFLDIVQPDAQTLLVLDFEANGQGPSMTLDQARAFVTHVNEQTGRWPGLYSGHYIKDLLGANSDPVLANCRFWLSQYGHTAVVPANWSTWTLWQYTNGAVGPHPHSVPGAGMCDRDKFNGDEAALRTLWGAA